VFGSNSPSKQFHRERVLKYVVEDGMLESDAITQADKDLADWNQPLALPETPADVAWA
jgi:hypothetical protein